MGRSARDAVIASRRRKAKGTKWTSVWPDVSHGAADEADALLHQGHDAVTQVFFSFFSLHANTAVGPENRTGLEKLCRYGYRQWMVTFPWPIRRLMAKDYRLITAAARIVIRPLFAFQRSLAKKQGIPTRQAKTAAVVFLQRHGSALNANVHFHALLPDAVFVMGHNETFELVELPAPTDQQVQHLLRKIARRVTASMTKHFDSIDEGQDLLGGAIYDAMVDLSTAARSLPDGSRAPSPGSAGGHHHRTGMTETTEGTCHHRRWMILGQLLKMQFDLPMRRLGGGRSKINCRSWSALDATYLFCDGPLSPGLGSKVPTPRRGL